MRAICVDDERQDLEALVSLCETLPQIHALQGFSRAQDALDWLEDNGAELALLDINMPEMDGLRLAEELRRRRPGMAVVFVTGDARHAVEAFALHVSGYLLKPVSRERLSAELDYLLSRPAARPSAHVVMHTFGNFDVFVDGEPLRFPAAKSKELLAYLVDRQGCCVTRREVFSALWEERPYDRGMQKQLDVYIRKLRGTLRAYGVEEIFELQRGTLRVRPETFLCDAYLFLAGNSAIVRQYRGEYMSEYSWANRTESKLTWNWENNA